LSVIASSNQKLLRKATEHHELERSDRNSASLDPVGGLPLPNNLRSYFEPRFAHDFSAVRLHYDAQAATAAERINAKAFTLGNSIGFGRGRFAPHTPQGRELLAHELAHVVQQSRGPGSPPPGADPRSELDAHQAAKAVAGTGGIARVRTASGTGIARADDDKTPFWKRTLNPLYQKALKVLPPPAAAKLEELNEDARKFVQNNKITDAQLDTAARVIEPVVAKVDAVLSAAKPPPAAKTTSSAVPGAPVTSKAGAKAATPVINTDTLSPQARKEFEDAAQNWAEIDLAFKEGERLDGDLSDYSKDPDYIDQFEGTPEYDAFTKTVRLQFKDGKSYVLQPKIVRALLETGTASPSPLLLFSRNVFNHKITPSNMNRTTTPRLVEWIADNREVIENSDLLLSAGKGTAAVAQKRINDRLVRQLAGSPVEIATTEILMAQSEGGENLEKALAVYQILKLPLALVGTAGTKGVGGKAPDVPPGQRPYSIDISDIPQQPLELETPVQFLERQALARGAHSGIDVSGAERGALELQSSADWLATQGRSGPPPGGLDVKLTNQRPPFGWRLSRADELNYVQLSPDINPSPRGTVKFRTMGYDPAPPPGGGTRQFGPRNYTWDAQGNLTEASTTELTLGIRDKSYYSSFEGLQTNENYGHLLGVQFGGIDAQIGRFGGFRQAASVNLSGGAWRSAEEAAFRATVQLHEAGQSYRVVAQAGGFVNKAPSSTRIFVESGNRIVYDSGWIANPVSP
jgi:hypothetical protein